MVSDPLKVTLPVSLDTLKSEPKNLKKVIDDHQERLKKAGDWEIFPKTIEMIARGRFSLDEENNVYVDGKPVPSGFRMPPELR
jgi:phosphoribosylglycinamide formyltransferase-1